MPASRQQDIINLIFNAIIDSVGPEVGNRVYDSQADATRDGVVTLPLITHSVITDNDELLLGDGRINNTFIQVSFFGKKSEGVPTLRNIKDNFLEFIDGYILSNGMSVRIENKGITLISDIQDESVHILTELNIK